MENRKTAMQELFDNLESIDITVPIGVKKIFLEKEKEQIIKAVDSNFSYDNNGYKTLGEQYYNETYGSEGSDAKDVVLGHKTSLDAQMLDRIEPKQETLEEAAERMYPNRDDLHLKREFKAGAKWQAERMYSEEDLKESWYDGMKSDNGFFGSFEEWFEQFKNK